MTVSTERRLAAILSADVVGYSRLMAENEDATVRTLTAYRQQIRILVQEHRGRVVDAPGDNLLAEFPTATDAVEAAVEIQRVIHARNAAAPEERRMEFRIGIHLGEVRVEGDRIYGDGVNVAARLEGLADPGSICISGAVHDQVRNKLDFRLEDLGEQRVKNIPDPVRVLRVWTEPARSAADVPRPRRRGILRAATLVLLIATGGIWLWSELGERLAVGPAATPADGGSPSIAVLPFSNISGDPEQEYFADGITEDLITDLSKISGLEVIARNSTFTYKDRTVRVQDVGRELGVGYVLEGSVRKSGSRVRVTAQLVEASNGRHVWAERYDRDLEDIFAVQDELTGEIVKALALNLSEGEQSRIREIPTDNLEAYDYFLRSGAGVYTSSRSSLLRSQTMLERAIELDPDFAAAYALLSQVHLSLWLSQLTEDPQAMQRATELAEKAAELDPEDPSVRRALCSVYNFSGRWSEAKAEAERALAVNPNDAEAYLCLASALNSGSPEEAFAPLERAARLDPHNWLVDWYYSLSYVLQGRFGESIPHLRRVVSRRLDFIPSHLLLACAYSQTGQEEKSREEVAEVRRINPSYSADEIRNRMVIQDEAVFERFLACVRPLGLG